MVEGAGRNLGAQPIARIMAETGLRPNDLVTASNVQMTHKMVTRACKGRWLTPHTRKTVLEALNAASGKKYTLADLFTY